MKFILGVVIGIVAVVFAVLNTNLVEVNLFFWTVTVSSAVMIVAVLIIGVVAGWLLAGVGRRRRRG